MRLHAIRITISLFQYAVQFCVYLVIVVIILRHAHLSHEIGTNVLCVALVAIAIGTALQALPKERQSRGQADECTGLECWQLCDYLNVMGAKIQPNSRRGLLRRVCLKPRAANEAGIARAARLRLRSHK
jgi:hypothetical protein